MYWNTNPTLQFLFPLNQFFLSKFSITLRLFFQFCVILLHNRPKRHPSWFSNKENNQKVSTSSRSTNMSSLKVIKTDWSSKAVCYSNEETNLLSNHYHHLTLKRKTSNRSVSGRSVSHLVRKRRQQLKMYEVVCSVSYVRTFDEFRICREVDWKILRSAVYYQKDFKSICLKLMTHQIFIIAHCKNPNLKTKYCCWLNGS